ncbi:MAG: alanine racemase [Lachnospiraceae bacterium]|nr:alanine racemase [Lachnospiraceae bacterium]
MKAVSRVQAAIDLDAVEHNFIQMRQNLRPGTKMIAVIKTDGYGHGALPIAELVESWEDIWGFAVATVEEACALREGGVQKPILLLGYTFPEHFEEIVRQELRPAVFQLETAKLLSQEALRQGKKVRIHIKVDTGMGRIGFSDQRESVETIRKIGELPQVELEGIFTHFARADERDKTSVNQQLSRFVSFVGLCEREGISFALRHCSNSAGIVELPKAHMDAVRAGIIIYGIYPSGEVDREKVRLKPVLSLKSHIVYIKEVEPGTSISYGGTYTTDTLRRIATIPVGYGDGYPRQLSNRGYVLVAGKRAPIRGRVCMDQMMVDVTEIPEAQEGMEVTLVGEELGGHISVEELGELSGRFPYEFVCCITKRVPRVYYCGGKALGMS